MKRRLVLASICLVYLLAFASQLLGGELEDGAIRAFFHEGDLNYEALFAPSFLKAIPIDKMEQVRKEYMTKLGGLKTIGLKGDQYELIFEKGRTVSKIALDSDRKIEMFWIGPMTLADDSIEKVLAELKKLKGRVSLTVLKNGTDEIVAHNPDSPLAVGSSFKLFVLEALEQKRQKENLGWDISIALNEAHRSLPSGILHKWPAGTQITIQTLAHLMISISDNTATDHLLFYVGRDAVEGIAPDRVKPFLSTAEMFRIKYGMTKKEQEEFLAGDIAAKRELLIKASQIPFEKLSFQSEPLLVDKVEWMITTRELCQVIHRLRQCSSLFINPGLAIKDDWHAVGYKGGSEAGVLNHTYLLQKKKDGPWYTVSITNTNPDTEIDVSTFNDIVVRLIGLLGKEGE
jgi:Beta-lactamase enzyme family